MNTLLSLCEVVGVGKSSVSRILKTFQDSLPSPAKRKEKCGLRQKILQRTDKILIRYGKINEIEERTDLRRDLLDCGVEVSASTVQKRALELCRKHLDRGERKSIFQNKKVDQKY
ncbi:HTH_Tnp_Tc3_2 domain-containing protein [Trichonephila clavipes]|nr:HTH_Tnp_Tc3_2 domain-containing protein [Trichonephila clavipes]